jgi:toxin-antitoxin system PIN domain toxin
VTVLADSNVLIALAVADHEHHAAARRWFEGLNEPLATCPITQGSLVRFLIREGIAGSAAGRVVEAIQAQDWHRFIPDDVGYDSSMVSLVAGHRQVTDAYLAALATRHDATVATLDRSMAVLHPNSVTLIESDED